MRRSTLYFIILVIAVFAVSILVPLTLRTEAPSQEAIGENFKSVTSLSPGQRVNALSVETAVRIINITVDSAAKAVAIETFGLPAGETEVSFDVAKGTLTISGDSDKRLNVLSITLPAGEPLTVAAGCGKATMLSITGLDTQALSIAGIPESLNINGCAIGLLAIGGSGDTSRIEIYDSGVNTLASSLPMSEVALEIDCGSSVGAMLFRPE